MFLKTKRFTRRLLHPIRPYYPTKRVLIHIGKCGGSTAISTLRSHQPPVSIDHVHIVQPVYFSNVEYYILARDPITRYVSAFNWRYRLVVEEEREKNRFPGEYEALSRYGSLNTLAEALYSNGGTNRQVDEDVGKIRHLYDNIAYYLRDFLSRCPPHQIKAVLMQETLSDDIQRVFNVQNTLHHKNNSLSTRRKDLSEQAITNLKRYLKEDYAALKKLQSQGKIQQHVLDQFV